MSINSIDDVEAFFGSAVKCLICGNTRNEVNFVCYRESNNDQIIKADCECGASNSFIDAFNYLKIIQSVSLKSGSLLLYSVATDQTAFAAPTDIQPSKILNGFIPFYKFFKLENFS